MQVDSLGEEQGEEQVGLAAKEDSGQAPAPGRLVGREGQRAYRDVGVGALGVGVSVMPVVLAYPPAVAHPDAEIAEQQAQDLANPSGPGDLLVAGVVAKEANLGEY